MRLLQYFALGCVLCWFGLVGTAHATAYTEADAMAACQAGILGPPQYCKDTVVNKLLAVCQYYADGIQGFCVTYGNGVCTDTHNTFTQNFPGKLSAGSTACKGGCQYVFQPGPGHQEDTAVSTTINSITMSYGTMTSNGNTCSPDDPTPPNSICDVATGMCLQYNGGGPPNVYICGGNGVCVAADGGGGGGPGPPPGCASNGSESLCIGPPSAPGPPPPAAPPPPGGPAPPPPTPPILPDAPAPPPFVITSTHQDGSGNPPPQATNNGADNKCGGSGQAPCATGSNSCGTGQYLVGGICISTAPPQCPSGTTQGASGCVSNTAPSCPPGQTSVGGVCSGGGNPATCPAGQTLSGSTCVTDPTCPAGQSLQAGRCVATNAPQCPTGQIADNDGVCHTGSCQTGYVSQGGVCVPAQPQCPANQTNVNGACQMNCSSGYTLVNGVCLQTVNNCTGGTLSGTYPNIACNCPSGLTLVNGVCATPPAQIECRGGTVISGQCYCPTGESFDNGACGTPTSPNTGGGTPPGGTSPGNNGNGNNNGGSTNTGGSNNGGSGTNPQSNNVDLCALHPSVEACEAVGSASGGTDCSAAPSCSGDQVACTIVFQEWHHNCPDAPPGEVATIAQQLDALPTDASSVTTMKDHSDITEFDSTGFLPSSGTCVEFAPITIAYGGFSQVADLSTGSWCLVSQALGALFLMVAYFRAAQILMRG